MRMADLPRRHKNSVPNWVEVTTRKQGRAISRRERLKRASNKRVASLPG